MKEEKKISIWLDKDLAPLFEKLNHKVNKPFFEHQLRSCFRKYDVSYLDLSVPYKIVPESFQSVEETIRTISKIIQRIVFIHDQIKHINETLDFLEPYL